MSSAITHAYRLARLPASLAAPARRAGLAPTALLVICMLAACSSTDSAADGASAVMTQAAQLALGTIDLEGTDQAVDGESASKLLPLWQLLADMSASTTAAPEELAAVVQEIEATMTAAQLDAIEAMDLPATEIAAAPPAARSSEAVTVGQTAEVVMEPAMGGEMGGMPPDGGGMTMDGGMPGGAAPASVDSGSSSAAVPASGKPASAALFQRVIALLQSKLQS